MSRGRDLPHLMNSWLNAPLMCTARYAEIAAAVFSGRLGIDSVRTEMGDLGRPELEAIAKQAKIEADSKSEARWKSGSNIMAVDNIAVIEIYGALTRTWGVGPYSGATGYDGILIQAQEAMEDSTIDGIWLDIDSGGGTVNGLFDTVDMIFSMNEKNGGKPIWAMAADYAYSAAFALGSAADRLYVPPSGGVGSVGTITMHASYKGALDKEGIDVTVMRWPELKAKGTEYELLDDDTKNRIMAQLRTLTGMFQDRVARNLSIPKSQVADTKGLDYMGADAKAIGFVYDTLPEAVAWEDFQRYLANR